ncbi:hypothetical protein SARC_03262 [Sphaeroforma arctica JP610]|uniref:Ribosomal RNA small subunit methyltransferase B-like ferredoxin-like domain-containing protein n=1 Tax=Sphaeroforma arctica JP610 TaxID=667725 RepID=A0A0L0G6K7_9EUKA|nr:hypothetical protein SARC_03262 [Sphaeroforma arctica JP610]KNC84516.1 hypothetical protein SARC_03262 [Sphaeroforma arctica JP610]|eukprot:XP_014158418.1 hypothetical protein SARC_03262 [Sphaeroforma arctica JP610]
MLRWALLSDDVTNNGEVAPIAPDSVPKCSDCAMNSASDVPDSWNSENVSPSQHQHNSTNFRVSSVFGCAQDEALVAQSKQPILSDGGHSQEKARSDYVELSPKDVVVCLLTMYVVHEEHARFEGNLSVSAEETSEWIEYAKRHLDCKEPEQLIARLQRAEPSRINWPPSDTTAYTAVYYSLPDWLVSQIVDTKGTASTNEIAAAMNRPGGIKLRCNTYMNDIPKLMDDLQAEEGIVTSPTRYTACGLKVDSPAKPQIVGTEIFKRGVYEVQDEGSQLIGLATGVERGMSVVDLCCGRGGKALHLADLLSRCRRPGVRQPFRSVNRGRKRVYSGDSDIPTGTSAREVDSGGCSFIERMVVDTNVHTRTTDDDVDSIVAEISVGACNTRTLCSLALCDTLKTGETHSAAPSTETDQSEALSVPGLLVCHDIDDTTLSVARRRLTSRPGAVDPMVGCGFVCSRAARQIVGGRGGDTARGRGGVGMDGVSEAHGRRDADVTAPTTHLGLETGANASTALHVDPRLARGVSTQTEGQVLVADTTVSVAEAADAYVDIPAIRANLMDNYTGIQDTHSPSPYADVVLRTKCAVGNEPGFAGTIPTTATTAAGVWGNAGEGWWRSGMCLFILLTVH